MSRRGGSRYDDDDRGYYADPPPQRSAPPTRTRARDLEEIDINFRRSERESVADRQPEFMRREYVENDQPLVLRKREVETITRPIERQRSPSPERVRTRTIIRERERSPSVAPTERTRTRIVERERDYSPEPPPPQRFSGARRTEVVYDRSRERDRSPETEIRTRTRITEREREELAPPPERITSRSVTRISERERRRSPSVEEEERIQIISRTRRRSPSPESSPSPPPAPIEPPVIRAPPIHQEIITHHRHIDHGYQYEPMIAPTPPPPRRPSPPREREREIDIDIKTGRGETDIEIYKSYANKAVDAAAHIADRTYSSRDREPERSPPPPRRERREFYDDDVLIERDRERLRVRDQRVERRRSFDGRRDRIRDDEDEGDFYARKTEERAYVGEAYHGATKDWAIVDVPPGTERVRMDGVGGGSQEVSWQKYNGVRRSKFIPERDSLAVYDRETKERAPGSDRERDSLRIEINSNDDRRVGRPLPPRNRYGDMWTEITKDLVVREAIEEMGYDFEETEFFYYVIQYLRYEDVQELVELSEHIRKERQNRIREIAWERERREEWEKREAKERRRLPEYEDERIIEREIIYDAPYRPRGYLR